jgi:aspartyl protease family protein
MLDLSGMKQSLGAVCAGKGTELLSATGGFTIPIKRRESNIPVIDVVFTNGDVKQSFEMMLDTGASATAITYDMATKLQVKSEGMIPVQTAGGIVPSARGRLASAQVGAIMVKDLIITINPSISIGLLGHNFFGDYDVTIRKEQIEFERRS